MSDQYKITPIILAGGSGTRLWPISRDALPKQFCALNGKTSLFQQTLLRTSDRRLFNEPVIIGNETHLSIVARQAAEIGQSYRLLIAEPQGRDTAAAIALAVEGVHLPKDELMLVLPSDHQVLDDDAFKMAVHEGTKAAAEGRIVVFGIQPDRPETAYGYIRAGQVLPGTNLCELQGFIEKPSKVDAELLVQERRVYWNAGMFLFDPKRVRAEFDQLAEPVIRWVRQSLRNATRAPDTIFPEPTAFASVKKISFDFAIMEHTAHATVVPVDPKWSDLGSWDAIWENSDKDASANVTTGNVYVSDTRNSLAFSDGPLVGVAGLEDVVVVANRDAVLVTSRKNSQSVKHLVEDLRRDDLPAVKSHAGETRPWGKFESLDKGAMHQVKRITVKPGGQLSLQFHHHRMEHWIVVTGTATVTVGEDVRELSASEQVFIPKGAVHRLENFTDDPVEIIEVQYGSYLGEDDIVRVEDVYGRPEKVATHAA